MDEQQQNLQKLQDILKLIGNTITKGEFIEAFKQVIKLVLGIQETTRAAIAKLESTYENLVQHGKDTHAQALTDLKKQTNDLFVRDRLNAMDKRVDDKLSTVKNGKDGKSPRPEDVVPHVMKQVRMPKDGSPDTPEDIRGKLESLKGKDRLNVSAVDGLDEMIKQANKDGKSVEFRGGRVGFLLYIGGVKKALITNINFVAGTGMAISYTKVNGQDTVTLAATGSGVTVETPTGTVNATNKVFTPTSQPKWIVADGTTYYEGAGYSWNGTDITTDIAPSSFIRDIY